MSIDNTLTQKTADLDKLLKLFQESGCEVSKGGKSYCLKLPCWTKFFNLKRMVHTMNLLAGHNLLEPAAVEKNCGGHNTFRFFDSSLQKMLISLKYIIVAIVFLLK